MGGQAEVTGLVKGAIIEDEEMEVGRGGGSHLLQEEVKEGAGERGEFQKEALACRRFHGSIQRETLEPVGGRDHGLQAPRGQSPNSPQWWSCPRPLLCSETSPAAGSPAWLGPRRVRQRRPTGQTGQPP